MGTYFNLENGKKVSIPSCLFGTPTYVKDLTISITKLIKNKKNGIYHIVGPEYINRLKWAQNIAQTFNFKKDLVEEIHDFKNIPKRPLKIRLENKKVIHDTGHIFKNLEEGFNCIKKEINAEIQKEKKGLHV